MHLILNGFDLPKMFSVSRTGCNGVLVHNTLQLLSKLQICKQMLDIKIRRQICTYLLKPKNYAQKI